MTKEQAVEFVIKELGKHHSRNEIIIALCERTRLNWDQAEKFIQEVEAEHGRKITARQSPILIAFGIGLIVIGLGMTCYNSVYFAGYFQARHDVSLDAALELRSLYIRAGSMLTGVAMTVGGIIGSWETVANLLKE